MRTATAMLVALGITGLLPLAAPAQTPKIGFKERSQADIDTYFTLEIDKCMTEQNGHLKLISNTNIPAGTQVTYTVRTVEGHDPFRNHGVQAWLAPGSTLSELPGNVITGTTSGSGTEVYLPNLCWADNLIDGSRGSGFTGKYYSIIEIQLVNVSGFSIDFHASKVQYVIGDRDDCDRPDFLTQNGGVVYQIRNGRSCTCTKQSWIVRGGIAQGETESYATTALNWRTDSTSYCPESPYQRPKN
ncbi:MAG: hypothetical protein OXE94_05705 [Aestuariivita sp.]|nr:hypothetical protein [Aestuariivita sp.]MCY4203629.1 hypothetical protein [Aestuariivita sp.]